MRGLVAPFRYIILAPKSIPAGFMDGRKATEALIEALQLENTEYRLGHSKVCFLCRHWGCVSNMVATCEWVGSTFKHGDHPLEIYLVCVL